MRKFNVTVNGKSYEVEVEEAGAGDPTPSKVLEPAASAPVAAKPAAAGGTPVNSPMPGLILGLSHKDGDTVKKNEPIITLEAMKMENAINAPSDGVITYAVKKGDNVETGTVLAYIR